MAVQLDPSIIGQVQLTPINSLMKTYSDAASVQQHMLQTSQMQQAQAQQALQNSAYQAATDENGNVDQNKLMAYMAQNGGGSAIPALQKSALDVQKTRAEISDKQATTDNNTQAGLHNSLKLVDNTLASLIAKPDVNEKDVYGEMGRLVNAGAFNVQAAHQGTTPDKYAMDLVSTMPVGNPTGLKNWLVQQGMRVADATKRMELSLPQYNQQDRGGTINEGQINQLTGTRIAGPDVTKTQTPDSAAAQATARRGQDMVDARAKENDVSANPQQQENIARMIADGRMAPLSGPSLRTADGLAIMSRVAELNPEFRGQNYGAVSKATSDFTVGKAGTTVRSFNVALSHLDTLGKLADAMGNNDTQAVNKVSNFFSQQSGGTAVTNFDTAKKVVADEVVKAIVGSGGGVSDRQEAAKVIMASNSPKQLAGAIQTYKDLMHGQLDGLQQQYSATTGLNDFDKFLSPESRALRAARSPGSHSVAIPAPAPIAAPQGGTAPARRSTDQQSTIPPIDSFFRR